MKSGHALAVVHTGYILTFLDYCTSFHTKFDRSRRHHGRIRRLGSAEKCFVKMLVALIVFFCFFFFSPRSRALFSRAIGIIVRGNKAGISLGAFSGWFGLGRANATTGMSAVTMRFWALLDLLRRIVVCRRAYNVRYDPSDRVGYCNISEYNKSSWSVRFFYPVEWSLCRYGKVTLDDSIPFIFFSGTVCALLSFRFFEGISCSSSSKKQKHCFKGRLLPRFR